MTDQMLVTPPVALVDILDRVLAKGAVVTGEIVIGIADIDLIRISLRLLLASVRAELTDTAAPTPVGLPAADAAVTW